MAWPRARVEGERPSSFEGWTEGYVCYCCEKKKRKGQEQAECNSCMPEYACFFSFSFLKKGREESSMLITHPFRENVGPADDNESK